MTITLDQLTLQNTPYTSTLTYSEGFPLGVPTDYSWYRGDAGIDNPVPPSNFTSMTGWAAVYPEVGQNNSADAAATVQVANMDAWVHLKATDQWVQVQNENTGSLGGAHFIGDFSGATLNMPIISNADGSETFGGPPVGYNDHWWIDPRGNYTAGSVDGLYVQMDIRESDPNAHLVAQVGADWWRSDSAPYVSDFSNNPGVGSTNWVELTTNYKTIGFSSMNMPTFEAHLSNLSGLFDAAPPPPPPPPPPPVDTTPPDAPQNFIFAPDTGVIGDGITTARNLTLSGTAEAFSTVTVTDGSATIGTAHAAVDGHWDIATARQSRGDHVFEATATDAAGNVSNPSALDVTVVANHHHWLMA